MGIPSKRVFLSAATSDFKTTRKVLAAGLDSRVYSVDWQENLGQGGGKTLAKLAGDIRNSDVLVHLVGPECGANPQAAEVKDLLSSPTYRGLPDFFPGVLDRAALDGLSITQWEGFLALYLRIPCLLFRRAGLPEFEAEPAPPQPLNPRHRQHQHWQRIKTLGEDRGEFGDDRDLVIQVFRALLENRILPESAPPPSAADRIAWPAADPGFHAKLGARVADREHVIAAFEAAITGQPPGKRILLVRGASGCSKSSLVKSLCLYARHLGLKAAHVELEGRPFDRVLAEVVDGLHLPREVTGIQAGTVVRALRDLARPVFLALDTFDKAERGVADWIRDTLLTELNAMPGVVLVVSGQQVPAADDLDRWRNWAETFELAPLLELPPWERHFRAQGIDLDVPGRLDFLHDMVRECEGIPARIDTVVGATFRLAGNGGRA